VGGKGGWYSRFIVAWGSWDNLDEFLGQCLLWCSPTAEEKKDEKKEESEESDDDMGFGLFD
jgi:hypothetical protein